MFDFQLNNKHKRKKSKIMSYARFWIIKICVWFHDKDILPLVSNHACRSFSMFSMISNIKIKLKTNSYTKLSNFSYLIAYNCILSLKIHKHIVEVEVIVLWMTVPTDSIVAVPSYPAGLCLNDQLAKLSQTFCMCDITYPLWLMILTLFRKKIWDARAHKILQKM